MFNNLRELITNLKTEKDCRDYLAAQRWNDKPLCPYCGCDNIYRIKERDRYKCGNAECYKKFSVTVGTIFEASKIPLLKWFTAIYLSTAHKKGISSYQLGRDIQVSQKTAWFMLHRIREMMRPKVASKLDNIVEADITFIGGSLSNKHYKVRKEWAEAEKDWKFNKVSTLGMIERNGELKMQVIDAATDKAHQMVRDNLEYAANIVTDEGFRGLNDDFYHNTVNHSKNEFARLHYNTNSIEGAFSHLKRMVYGIYHQISQQHTHRYLYEFTYRYNSRKVLDKDRFISSLQKVEGRLTYKTLVAASKPETRYHRAKKSYRIKPVIKRLDDEVIEQYPGMAIAARQNKLAISGIQQAIKNKGKCGGFNWEFA